MSWNSRFLPAPEESKEHPEFRFRPVILALFSLGAGAMLLIIAAYYLYIDEYSTAYLSLGLALYMLIAYLGSLRLPRNKWVLIFAYYFAVGLVFFALSFQDGFYYFLFPLVVLSALLLGFESLGVLAIILAGSYWQRDILLVMLDKQGDMFLFSMALGMSYILSIIFYQLIRYSMKSTQKLQDHLETQALTDSLTGVYNRRFYQEKIAKEIHRSQRYGDPLSIILMDLDKFKKINDTYGHDSGDYVLKRFASICQKSLRDSDTLARIGGEEFIAILSKTDTAGSMVCASRIRESVEQNLKLPDKKTPACTVSIGVAQMMKDDTPDTLLKRADKALYMAKNAGRNKVIHYGRA